MPGRPDPDRPTTEQGARILPALEKVTPILEQVGPALAEVAPAIQKVAPALETMEQRLERIESRLLLLTKANDESRRAVTELRQSVVLLIELMTATAT